MKRAEEAALEAYPVKMTQLVYQELIDACGGRTEMDTNLYSRKLFQGGYEQAEEVLGWHSVDERLPKVDEEVIVLTDELGTAPIYKIAFGHIVDKERYLDYNGWNIPGVKFWMPLPEIPKEEKK